MQTLIAIVVGLILSPPVVAEPLMEGWVRLDSGEPVAAAQVRLFDISDLEREAIARATTDSTGYFALPLSALTGRVLPERFTLGPNYPNPFNPSTIIPYQLAASSAVQLEVFNLLGQHLATLVDGERPAGFHTAIWDATDGAGRAVGAGVYIYRMTVGAASQTGRMVLVDGQAGVSAGGAALDELGASGGGRLDGEQVYGLIVSGEGLVPYVDPAFRVEAGMAPVEWVVSADLHSAGKATKEQGANGQVAIPDAKLQAAIAAALGKATGATITQAEMETLTTLSARNADIRDLTGLEFATNLTRLDLDNNAISDISPLSELTNLTWLDLWNNAISDISPLSELTNLTWLSFWNNAISDISPLSGLTNLTSLLLSFNAISDISPLSELTNLTRLSLDDNAISDISPLRRLTNLTSLSLYDNAISDISPLSRLTNLTRLDLMSNTISDISPLRRLTNLTWLSLWDNAISDISPLRALTNLARLDLRANYLNDAAINNHIYVFKKRGATVLFDSLREGDFDIELVFLSTNFTEREQKVIEYAARRWMSILRKDLPDYTLTERWSGACGDLSYAIPSGERIDDLRIYVISFDDDKDVDRYIAGWGGPRGVRDKPQLPFLGCMAFNNLDYNVSVTTALHEIGHVLGIGTIWDHRVRDPNGDPHFNGPLAVGAFDAAGGRNYTGKKVPVDRDLAHWRASVLQGELMRAGGSGRHLSEITTRALADLGYVVDFAQADAYTLPGAAAKVSAKAVAAVPSMLGDDRLPGRLAPQPKWTCGVGQQREPIYVVDPQGRVVRTISP